MAPPVPSPVTAAPPPDTAAGASRDLALPDDLFIIPDEGRFLVYSPFTLGVASVDAETAQRFQDVRQGLATLDCFAADYLAALIDAGIITTRAQAGMRPHFPEKTAFDPVGLTLFLTTNCSLGCTYCYASANDRPSVMTWDTARTALDWAFRHAESRGRDEIGIIFHGGGEVTVAFDLLVKCVEYARAEAAARGIRVFTTAGLNGVMRGHVLEWVIANLDNATVSLDGLPEVHNAQRPLLNGKGSFDIVAAAIRRMDEARFQYGLRVTVTRLALDRLPEAVEFMCREFGARVIQLEPLASTGRARAEGAQAPDPQDFIRQFRVARGVARRYGRHIVYSGARFGTITNGFCQTTEDLLGVTPGGFLSGCYEVGQPDDPRADTFFYGMLDPARGTIDVDMKKVIRLRTLTVEHKSGCDTCFCRWSCAGECSARLAQDGGPWRTGHSARCTINRALTLDQMKDYLDGVAPLPGAQPKLEPV